MRRVIFVAFSLLPSLALAQPVEPPPSPPPPPPSAPPDPGAPVPAPAPAPAPAPPPPAGYYQPQQPVYAPPAAQSLRSGMTFEANLGIGWIRLTDESSDSETSDAGFAGLSLGVGGWVSPQTAITARLSGVTVSEQGARFSAIFLGPSAQYWFDDHFWAGGGAGLGIVAVSFDDGSGSSSDSITGFSFDLRVGYTFNAGTENTFNASFELNPGFYSENNSSGTATGIGFLVGYQHL